MHGVNIGVNEVNAKHLKATIIAYSNNFIEKMQRGRKQSENTRKQCKKNAKSKSK